MNNGLRFSTNIEEGDSDVGKASYRLVILKQRFPASTVKTIVRKLLKCAVLTIIDSDVLKNGLPNA